MEPSDEQRATLLLDQWLADHPERLTERRADEENFRHWRRAAVRRLMNGTDEDADIILTQFATQAEAQTTF